MLFWESEGRLTESFLATFHSEWLCSSYNTSAKQAEQSEKSQIKTLSCRYCAEGRVRLTMSPSSVFQCMSCSSKKHTLKCGGPESGSNNKGLLHWEALPPAAQGVPLCVDTVCTVGKRQWQEGVLLEPWVCFPSAYYGIYKRSYPTQEGFPLVTRDTFSRDEHQHLSSIQRGQSNSRSDKFRENVSVVKQHRLITSLWSEGGLWTCLV